MIPQEVQMSMLPHLIILNAARSKKRVSPDAAGEIADLYEALFWIYVILFGTLGIGTIAGIIYFSIVGW